MSTEKGRNIFKKAGVAKTEKKKRKEAARNKKRRSPKTIVFLLLKAAKSPFWAVITGPKLRNAACNPLN